MTKDNFLEAFFDYVVPESSKDLAAKKENIRFTDNFTIFKVEKSIENDTRE